ncbi:DUF805 domain-containing protein [Insolitispirillum peregrinum]|uniref:DUF805 domain-containing protein n=1 Tax=Insolitispirillum peregrinum TaxID=80876 RepID=UPI00097077BB|nr:DUF805 domain-containing protein [Insolitispirillum peregrinum]
MGFSDAVSSFFNKYAVFKGRSSRSEYNYARIFMYLSSFILSIISSIESYYNIYSHNEYGFYSPLSSIVHILFIISVIIPSISLFIRRLHDLNFSGWWFWLWPAVVIFAFALIFRDSLFTSWAVSGLLLFLVVSEVLLMCIRGTVGPNRFGPDPLATGGPEQAPVPASE